MPNIHNWHTATNTNHIAIRTNNGQVPEPARPRRVFWKLRKLFN